MDRKGICIIAGVMLLGFLALAGAQAIAQRDFRTESRPPSAEPPRYQVVNVTDGEVIIMDSTTGDLYSAKPQDVKPYAARPGARQTAPAFHSGETGRTFSTEKATGRLLPYEEKKNTSRAAPPATGRATGIETKREFDHKTTRKD